MLVTQGSRIKDPSEATMFLGSANAHEKRSHLGFLWQVTEMNADGTKVYVCRVVWETLTYRPSKTRSHPAAIPLLPTMRTFEVLKVPTWLEAFENDTQIEPHSSLPYYLRSIL